MSNQLSRVLFLSISFYLASKRFILIRCASSFNFTGLSRNSRISLCHDERHSGLEILRGLRNFFPPIKGELL
jgi:hypothetical protein